MPELNLALIQTDGESYISSSSATYIEQDVVFHYVKGVFWNIVFE